MTRILLAHPIIFKNSNTVHSMSIGICQPSLNSSSYKCLQSPVKFCSLIVGGGITCAVTNLMLCEYSSITLLARTQETFQPIQFLGAVHLEQQCCGQAKIPNCLLWFCVLQYVTSLEPWERIGPSLSRKWGLVKKRFNNGLRLMLIMMTAVDVLGERKTRNRGNSPVLIYNEIQTGFGYCWSL